jgi:hypothetical protein
MVAGRVIGLSVLCWFGVLREAEVLMSKLHMGKRARSIQRLREYSVRRRVSGGSESANTDIYAVLAGNYISLLSAER